MSESHLGCNHDGHCLYVEVVDPVGSGMDGGLDAAVAAFGPSCAVHEDSVVSTIERKPKFAALWCSICGTLFACPGYLPGEEIQSAPQMQPLLVKAAESWGQLRTLRTLQQMREELREKIRGDAIAVPLVVADDAISEEKSAEAWSVYAELFCQMERCPQCDGEKRLRKMMLPTLPASMGDALVIVCDGCGWQLHRDSPRPEYAT